jgi:hypothetical protein
MHSKPRTAGSVIPSCCPTGVDQVPVTFSTGESLLAIVPVSNIMPIHAFPHSTDNEEHDPSIAAGLSCTERKPTATQPPFSSGGMTMKVERIELFHVAIPLPRPFYPAWIPGYPQTENRFTLLRLTTDDGVQGLAGGWPSSASARDWVA